MKKVKFTLNQINEVLNVAVDVQNGDVKSSIQNAKNQTDKSVGPSVERNYVISGDEVNEYYDPENNENDSDSKTFTKKQINLARLKKIKESGVCYSKKELEESFNN